MYGTAILNHAGGGQLNDFNPEYLISIQLLNCTSVWQQAKLHHYSLSTLGSEVHCHTKKPHGKWAS